MQQGYRPPVRQHISQQEKKRRTRKTVTAIAISVASIAVLIAIAVLVFPNNAAKSNDPPTTNAIKSFSQSFLDIASTVGNDNVRSIKGSYRSTFDDGHELYVASPEIGISVNYEYDKSNDLITRIGYVSDLDGKVSKKCFSYVIPIIMAWDRTATKDEAMEIMQSTILTSLQNQIMGDENGIVFPFNQNTYISMVDNEKKQFVFYINRDE